MSEQIKCVVDTGLEKDSLLVREHHLFAKFIEQAGVRVIGDRSIAPMPEHAVKEAVLERTRLEMIGEKAGALALWLNGQPPRNSMAVAAGFAAARGIPIVGMRTEQYARTGEDGLSFNLMLHAAIEYSKNPQFGYEDSVHLASNLIEMRDEVAAVAKGAPISAPMAERGDEVYVASPFGFAESTKGFYKKEILPLIGRYTSFIDPWEIAGEEVAIAMSATGQNKPAAWTVLGISHLERIRRCKLYIGCIDQEPADIGTLVEVGAAAGFGKPAIIYRNDLRTCSEGPSKFEASVQAAANLWLPKEQAIAKHDNFPTELDQLEQEIGMVIGTLANV